MKDDLLQSLGGRGNNIGHISFDGHNPSPFYFRIYLGFYEKFSKVYYYY